MKKLIYKVTIKRLFTDSDSDPDFNGVFGIYDDGTFEFLDCSESERKEKEKRLAKEKQLDFPYMHYSLNEMCNPRHPKAFCTLLGIMNETHSENPDMMEYFGDGEPWERLPELEGVLI